MAPGGAVVASAGITSPALSGRRRFQCAWSAPRVTVVPGGSVKPKNACAAAQLALIHGAIIIEGDKAGRARKATDDLIAGKCALPDVILPLQRPRHLHAADIGDDR